MITPDYYYVIVGGGMAGLQLASQMNEDIFFKGKKIAIIDPDDKSRNDKTWCFWERNHGTWDHLIHKSWQKGKFISHETTKELDLAPYSYKMLRSIDFYESVRSRLKESDDIIFIKDKIQKIDQVTRSAIGENDNYTATHFFDSRPPGNIQDISKSAFIYQHFKGWYIETEDSVFDPEVFTMMDYRIKHEQSSSFTYVLPITNKKALIEFTFFTPYLTADDIYDNYLEKYIREILGIKSFSIIEEEKGMIPMTDYPFHRENTSKVTKIGTAGGWVKASSGYSFKNTEKKVALLIKNIKKGVKPSENLISKKFSKYDAIFLDVLEKRNELGESLFTKFYTRNNIQDIFRFLDEETKLSEDIKIMLSLYHPQFVKSFFKKL